MNYDVNGWQILSCQFANDSGAGKMLEGILGEKIDVSQIANGAYLLDYEEIAALIDCLSLPHKRAVELLSVIISARSKSGKLSGLSDLRQLLCIFSGKSRQDIPCFEIESLRQNKISAENLSDFLRQSATDSIKLSLPPQSCALKITDEKSAAELALPCGSLVIVDSATPPAPDELSLYCTVNGTFGMAAPEQIPSALILWSMAILRLHIRPIALD